MEEGGCGRNFEASASGDRPDASAGLALAPSLGARAMSPGARGPSIGALPHSSLRPTNAPGTWRACADNGRACSFLTSA